MKKIIISVSIILFNIGLLMLMINFNQLKIETIELIDYNSNKNEITIRIKKGDTLFGVNYECVAQNNKRTIDASGNKDECILHIPFGDDYNIYLKNKKIKSIEYNLFDYINKIIKFNFDSKVIYLAKGESKKINYTYVAKNEDEINLIVENNEIVNLENFVLYGLNDGETTLYETNSNQSIKIVVTDLITVPTLEDNKQIIPCNRYNKEEADLLDEILKEKIETAGYQTRASAVETARFLLLQFPYKIPYFYENGRVSPRAVHFADGEGRYYHKGLYLNDSKKSEILYKVSGPAIWGCPLRNWEDDPTYGYYYGKLMSNGLDCSGFVSWVLYNAGFDPGDIGAGENEDNPYQLTDLGNWTKLTTNLIYSNKIKAGDLFNFWGHIAIIIGIDDENFYVAESLQTFGGVSVRTYKKSNVNKTFTHVVLMDNYYKSDGNYTEMWK